jgi:YegS/Rv2252/BmrU family lipid kinase
MLAQLLVNECSRRGREAAHLVRASLARARIETVEDGWPDDISAAVDCIVAAGGDGTLVHAIGPALARGLPVGVIPLGTFNELARTLDLPQDIDGAVRVIARRYERRIDVARVNGAYYVNEASIGVSSRITRLQTPELKQRFGLFGVLATAFQAFRHSRPMRVDVGCNGTWERMRTIQLTVANSHRFGGFLNVEGAAIDDGWLDLYSVDISGAIEAFPIALAMFQGRRRNVPGLRSLRAHAFDVRTRRPHRIVADGEPAGTTPARFESLPRALRVFVPAPRADE